MRHVYQLFTWPPALAVWSNYEVVMFQPWSGTAPILGSVAIVAPSLLLTSYLKTLSHYSTVFWIRPLHPLCTDPPSHLPPWDWAAPLFCTRFPPSFRSWTAWPNKLPSWRPLLPVLHSLSCRPRPAPQVLVGQRIPTPWARFCRFAPVWLPPFLWPRRC